MNGNAAAHAVTDDSAALAIDVSPARQITPAGVQDFDELPVGSLLLSLMNAVRFSKQFVEIGNDCGVTQSGKITDRRLHVTGDAIMMMNDHDAGSGITFGVRQLTGNAVFFRKIAVNDLHKLNRSFSENCYRS